MTLDKILDNPYYWTNNKRRMHGLKPIRKDKKRIRRLLKSPEFFDAINQEFEKRIIEEVNKLFNNFADIKDIKAGDANYEE